MSVAAGHGVIESNPANNSASATLSVAPKSVAPSCVVPALKLTPVSVAKRVLNLLNCKAGKVGHARSKSVRKGHVGSRLPPRRAPQIRPPARASAWAGLGSDPLLDPQRRLRPTPDGIRLALPSQLREAPRRSSSVG